MLFGKKELCSVIKDFHIVIVEEYFGSFYRT